MKRILAVLWEMEGGRKDDRRCALDVVSNECLKCGVRGRNKPWKRRHL